MFPFGNTLIREKALTIANENNYTSLRGVKLASVIITL
jgi:hypothetical protein